MTRSADLRRTSAVFIDALRRSVGNAKGSVQVTTVEIQITFRDGTYISRIGSPLGSNSFESSEPPTQRELDAFARSVALAQADANAPDVHETAALFVENRMVLSAFLLELTAAEIPFSVDDLAGGGALPEIDFTSGTRVVVPMTSLNHARRILQDLSSP